MNKFFSPKSIAIVGASATPGKTGNAVLQNIINGGFTGDIWPINPHQTEILNHPAYKTLSDTPTPAELAIIVIPAQHVPQVIQEGAEIGIKNFVIITAGFGEIGEPGAHLDKELLQIINKHDIRIMGPNCLGVIAPHSKLNAAFGGPLPIAGNVSLISQSGAIVSSLCDWATMKNFGFSKVVSLGNKLNLDENQCLEYLAEDNTTDVIVLFIKKFKDRKRFLELSKKISKTKTIILYKSGERCPKGEGNNCKTHKELVCGLDEAGVIRARTMTDLFDLTYISSILPISNGNEISVITNAGGPGAIAFDTVIDDPVLEFSIFSEEIKKELIQSLPEEALPINPVDIIGDAKADLYQKTLDIILKHNATDALMVMLSPQSMTQPKESAQAIINAKNKYPNIPIVTCFLGGESVQPGVELLQKNKIPCFLDPARAIWTLSVINYLGEIRRR